MSLLKFEILLSALKYGSLTAAAEEMGYTQSAVSHMINNLEDELGIRLIKRSRTGVSLTSNGEILIPYIRNILNENNNFQQALSEVTGNLKGKLTIGSFETINNTYLPDILEDFLGEYPNIDINIMESTYTQIEKWLEQEEIDCGFVSMPTNSKLNLIPILQDEYGIAINKNRPHSFINGDKITLEEILKEDLILMQGNDDLDMKKFLSSGSIPPRYKIITDDPTTCMKMVEKNMGIALMSKRLINDYLNYADLIEIKDGFTRTIYFAYNSKKNASPIAKKFIEFMELEELPSLK